MGDGVHLLGQAAVRTGGQAIAEDGPLEMVGLVLQAAGEQARALDGDRLAPRVDPGAGGLVRAGQAFVAAREGQAALVGGVEVAFLAGRGGDRRIAHGAVVDDVVGVGAQVHEQAEVAADLGGRQPDALRGAHGREHVGDQGA